MSATNAVPTSRRSDAELNRAKILTAARDAFAADDEDVSMAEVARRAGVGMATLYRNFADRQELLEAVYRDEVDAIVLATKTIEGENPRDRMDAWLRLFYTFITSKRRVAAGLLEQTDRTNTVFSSSRTRVTAAGHPLFVAAQQAGEVRGDLTFDQVLDMVHAIATVPGTAAGSAVMLQTILDGLHAGT